MTIVAIIKLDKYQLQKHIAHADWLSISFILIIYFRNAHLTKPVVIKYGGVAPLQFVKQGTFGLLTQLFMI